MSGITISEILSSAVISAAISLLTSVITTHISAKKEIQKLKLAREFQQEDSADSEMASAISSVELAIHSDNPEYYRMALARLAPVLFAYSGKLGEAIRILHQAFFEMDMDTVEAQLPVVIDLYAKEKSSFFTKFRRLFSTRR